MDSNLLEQLMKKPIPKKLAAVEIQLPGKGEVALETKIVDKTSLEFDAAALRKKLLRFERIEMSAPPPPPDISTTAPSVEIEVDSTPDGASAPPSHPPSQPRTKPAPKSRRPARDLFKLDDDDDDNEPANLDIIVDKRGKTIGDRLPKEPTKILLRSSSYFMNNRKKFIEFITTILLPYRRQMMDEGAGASCEKKTGKFSLLTHQKIVRDYINEFTPYRGLLLYHGLGSGKTCSSIAIAEGIKSTRQIIIMTPASLRMNYIQELKKCGDSLYKINQYWEFLPTEGKPELATSLAKVLSLPRSYIETKGGAWFVNIKRKSNYGRLNASQRQSIDEQVTKMLSAKYLFINYNGLRKSHLPQLRRRLGRQNIFDNCVVIIDEVHNFVSRIVNKIKQKESLSMKLYELLKKAQNCRIVCLTGTPVINYPNEIAILFNMLRGYIATYTIPLTINTQKKINEKRMKKILSEMGTLDYMRYQSSLKQLLVTRNPFGFVNAAQRGEKTLDERGDISDDEFIQQLTTNLGKHGIQVNNKQVKIELHTALPDNLDAFTKWFINEKSGELQNQNIFKKRILGLTSHFRSPQEELMPKFNKETDLHVVEVPMSDYQLNIYEQAREGERKMEMEQAKRRKKGRVQQGNNEQMYEDSVSTYRIFSRAFCNFVFPGEIKRPFPREDADVKQAAGEKLDEDTLDAADAAQKIQNIDGRFTADDKDALEAGIKSKVDETYELRIANALQELEKYRETFLSKEGLAQLSPKFLAILNNIEQKEGLHLVYSQFRTLEGIGILKLVLEANGFAHFKISKNKQGAWNIDMKEEDKGKPTFILYTGTESAEEKEIVRNIFNSSWDDVPRSLQKQLRMLSQNNFHGEIARVFMITAAGAEGISLRNVRYVHIMEPYWHPVRIEQVIGRARRICSHQGLPEVERQVEVFIYLMRFTEHQVAELISSELKIKDISKLDRQTPLTSDQALYEISTIKENINKQILKAIKEASIDCALQVRTGGNNLTCFAFTDASPEAFAYKPSLTGGDDDDVAAANRRERKVKIRTFNHGGKKYAYNPKDNEVYDFESYQITKTQKGAKPIVVGKIVEKDGAKNVEFL